MAEASEKNLTGEGLAELWELVKARDSKVASDAAAALSGKIVTGTYTGNGAASRTISLGFTPKAVFVADPYSNSYSSVPADRGGFAVTGSPAYSRYNVESVKITTNGFVVRFSNTSGESVLTNMKDIIYNYLAIA